MSKVYKSLFAAAVMILVLASAGCAEMPAASDPGWSGDLSPEEGGEDDDPGYLTPATPYPTATNGMAGPTLSRPTEVPPTQDPYVTLFNKTIEFSPAHLRDAYSFNLTAPPLIIDFDVEPKMVTREKYTTSDYGKKKDIVVKQEYPSEDSWFTVTVRERESGEIVAEDGFGKGFGTATDKRIFVGKFGDYLIELSGNEAKVHIKMRAGGI
ncbi:MULTISPECIES: hypothetical protein [Methanoculleus]|uniref:Lipoprotein n=2 Tax=Methanoculleus TaxID=45989 RepID=A3CVJ9_METMJ|nr:MULTISPECIES: hypothetical protein [Methanoculleus]ABN57399.1 hypothetical protein Memar_1470 [Methanoculleus marisnigri JR1]UYU18806.1 hypothetical protein OH143_01565 [Methanoculleus submarinus]